MLKKNCFDIVQRIISGKNKMLSKYDQTLNLNMKNPSEVNPNEPMFKQYVSNKKYAAWWNDRKYSVNVLALPQKRNWFWCEDSL